MICEKCGSFIPDGSASCEFCNQTNPSASNATTNDMPGTVPKRENVLLGIIGAVLGASLGGGSIILIGQLGFIASISGLILAICTLKGYELMGRRLSGKGAIICIILIIITPYIADRLDWAIAIVKSYPKYGITIGEAYNAVPEFIAEGYIEKASYIKNLVMLYVFAFLGAFGSVRDLFRK